MRKPANVAVPTQACQAMGDPDDNHIIECAVAGVSDYFITNDKDLLRLGSLGGIEMIRAAEFLAQAETNIPANRPATPPG